MPDDPRFPPHYAELVHALEVKLDAIDAARAVIDGASDPGAAIEAVNALREEALHIAIQVFAIGTVCRVDAKPNPTTEEQAAALVARRLMARPRDADDIKAWRVPVPYVFAPKGSKLDWTTAEEQQRQCCILVCRLIAQGMPRDKAMEQAEEQFHRGRSWVSAAYYDHREEFEAVVRLERG